MQYTIPHPSHRLTLPHISGLDGSDEGFNQGQEQNARIVAFARDVAPEGVEFLPVEVFYERDNGVTSTEADFDAVLVDLSAGSIVSTLPPYSEIDPNWEAKR